MNCRIYKVATALLITVMMASCTSDSGVHVLPSSKPTGRRFTRPPTAHTTYVEHTQIPDPIGILGTAFYGPTKRERKFYERLADDQRITFSDLRLKHDYRLDGKKGKYVSWLGIIRRRTIVDGRTEYLVEMKYFNGLTDLHLQTVDFAGAGDFLLSVPGKGHQVGHLNLVRAYGTISRYRDKLPVLDAEYVRHWVWGLFNFNAHAEKDLSNPQWRNGLALDGVRLYSSNPNYAYYELRLGKKASDDSTSKAIESRR